MSKRAFFFFLSALAFLPLSCKRREVSGNFNSFLQVADGYKAKGDTLKAKGELKSLLRRTRTESQFLSIFKRLDALGEKGLAEATLKKAFSRFGSSEKILAVYAHFLDKNQDFEAAKKVAAPLANGKYSSFLAKPIFSSAFSSSSPKSFLKSEFAPLFVSAANATGNDIFAQDAAVILARSGRLADAKSLHPQKIASNANFWAQIAYDSADFEQAAADLSHVSKTAESALLLADINVKREKFDEASAAWRILCEMLPDFSAVPYLNLARLGEMTGDFNLQDFYLRKAAAIFPDDIAVLRSLSDFAIRVNSQDEKDSFDEALEKKGLKSLEMQRLAERPKIDAREGINLMRASYRKTKNPVLPLEILRAENRLKKIPASQIKRADIWEILEKERPNDDLTHFFVWVLAVQKNFDDARAVFAKHLLSKYGDAELEERKIESFSDWEKEFAALFVSREVPSKKYADYSLAINFLQSLASSSGASAKTRLNLALLEEFNGNRKHALELCGEISALETDKTVKSLAEFRKGRIYVSLGDKANARRSLTYSLALNPDNFNSRKLLSELEGSL